MDQVTRETVQEQVYKGLRSSLMFGRFEPGQRLKLRTLAEAFGTSYLPVRDALGRLVAEGALDVLPNRSIVVPKLTRARVDDIWAIRVLMESHAIELAVERIGADELAQIKRLNKRIESCIKANRKSGLLEINHDFHFSIYGAARRPILLKVIESLWLQAGPFMSLTMQLEGRMLASLSCSHHHQVISAIEQGNALAARKAIADDLKHTAEYLRGEVQ